MRKILISECLYGERAVRYDNQKVILEDPLFLKWKEEGRLVPVCPEILGGLPVPREECQRSENRVLTRSGKDVTEVFTAGAEMVLSIARKHDAAFVILKERSPSCGSRVIYDGTFSGVKIPGQGVTAQLLLEAGLAVFNEEELAEAAKYLETVE